MATSNAKSSLDDDAESEVSHAFSTNSKFANAQVREIVKDNVFPIAKFLRSEDLPWSTEPQSLGVIRWLCGAILSQQT